MVGEMDREELIAEIESGAEPTYLLFWGYRQKQDGIVDASCLSQFFPAKFVLEGRTYRTAEHWMMAGKAELFDDREMLKEILAASDPKTAKALGRKVRNYDDSKWAAARVDRVVEGNLHKFRAHPKIREFLLSTADRVLVEASPRDRIWGIGLGRNSDDATNPRSWRGQNLLGFALMEVWAKLREG